MLKRGYIQKKRKIRLRTSPVFRIFFLFLVVSIFLYGWVHPGVSKAMQQQAKMLMSQKLAALTLEILEEMDADYSDFSEITRDDSGAVIAIETNTVRVGIFKNRLEQRVTQWFSSADVASYRIRLGTLLGQEYLTGRGPNITFRIQPLGVLTSDIASQFRSAGINQTLHQIFLNITLEVETAVPLFRSHETLKTNLLLAETVIVGKVPEYYTNITGLSGEIPEGIADFSVDPLDLER